MVQFGELRVVVEAGSGSRSLLQQHHAHGEVGNHGPADGGFGGKGLQILQLLRREAGGADHRMDAIGDRSPGVGIHHRRVREIHHHRTRTGSLITHGLAGGAERGLEIGRDRHIQKAEAQSFSHIHPFLAGGRIDRSHQLAIRRRLHRLDHLGTHPTKGPHHHHGDWSGS